MQQTNEPPTAHERSRRRPPRRRSEDPIPIPEAPSRGRRRRTRTVKLQQVLQAYQRAVVDVLEQRIAAASEAAAEAARKAVADALAERHPGLAEDDLAKGFLAYADERFQALGIRLQQIEEALRGGVPVSGTPGLPLEELSRRLEAMATAMTRLAEDHRALVEQVGHRTGQGVAAVVQVLRQDLEALAQDVAGLRADVAGLSTGMENVQGAVRSVHRTMAWEGMRTPRSGPDQPGSSPP